MTDIDKIPRLIGKSAVIEGRRLTVVEVLLDEQQVILEDAADRSDLQENQYGDIHRRVNRTWVIPFFSELEPDRIHPVLAAFLDDNAGEMTPHT